METTVTFFGSERKGKTEIVREILHAFPDDAPVYVFDRKSNKGLRPYVPDSFTPEDIEKIVQGQQKAVVQAQPARDFDY